MKKLLVIAAIALATLPMAAQDHWRNGFSVGAEGNFFAAERRCSEKPAERRKLQRLQRFNHQRKLHCLSRERAVCASASGFLLRSAWASSNPGSHTARWHNVPKGIERQGRPHDGSGDRSGMLRRLSLPDCQIEFRRVDRPLLRYRHQPT